MKNILNVIMIFLITITLFLEKNSYAGTWLTTVDWEVVNPGPRGTPFGNGYTKESFQLSRCVPGATADANGEAIYNGVGTPSCLFSEANKEWNSSHANYKCRSIGYHSGTKPWVLFELAWEPTANASGIINHPASPPSFVTCSKTYGPYTHTWKVNLVTDPRPGMFALPTSMTQVSWSSTVGITIPATFTTGDGVMKWVKIPSGSYSGAAVASTDATGVRLTTTSSGSTTISDTYCSVFDKPTGSDWLVMIVRSGKPAGNGYCKVNQGGVAKWMKFSWAY